MNQGDTAKVPRVILQEQTIKSQTPTSVHDTSGVHVFQCAADLDKVFPDCPFRDESTLLLEVL